MFASGRIKDGGIEEPGLPCAYGVEYEYDWGKFSCATLKTCVTKRLEFLGISGDMDPPFYGSLVSAHAEGW
jgi:hypothetical protein